MYVGLHFGNPEVGAAFMPDFIPAPYFWNYFTAVCILLFIVSAVIGKYDKLAYSLMAILFTYPGAMGHEVGVEAMTADLAREKELEIRNIMVTGALLGFARYDAKDNRIIG